MDKSSLRFKESSLRFAEIKIAFQRIKCAFCRNQVCIFLKSSLRFSEIKFAFSRNQVYVSQNQVRVLRTPVRKYREFRDSTKKSNFFLFFQKVPFDELFSKKICTRSSAFYFLRNKENSKMRPDRPRSLMEIMQNRAFSIFIFSRTETCLKFILGQVVIHLYDILSRYISF